MSYRIDAEAVLFSTHVLKQYDGTRVVTCSETVSVASKYERLYGEARDVRVIRGDLEVQHSSAMGIQALSEGLTTEEYVENVLREMAEEFRDISACYTEIYARLWVVDSPLNAIIWGGNNRGEFVFADAAPSVVPDSPRRDGAAMQREIDLVDALQNDIAQLQDELSVIEQMIANTRG